MVELKHVSFSFGGQPALADVSFALEPGEFLFLTGHSGAGKTTLLRLLHGALPLSRGAATVCGFDLRSLKKRHIPMLRRKVGVVFQDFKILMERSVFENISLALEVRGMSRGMRERRVRAIIRALGLEKKSYTPCRKLSGGEQQRVAIARSMVVNPSLILADEPTGNLDADLTGHLMDIFKQFHTYGTTIIMATHSHEVLDKVPGARLLHLENGQVAGSGLVPEAGPRKGFAHMPDPLADPVLDARAAEPVLTLGEDMMLPGMSDHLRQLAEQGAAESREPGGVEQNADRAETMDLTGLSMPELFEGEPAGFDGPSGQGGRAPETRPRSHEDFFGRAFDDDEGTS